jgi:hypothetical protein
MLFRNASGKLSFAAQQHRTANFSITRQAQTSTTGSVTIGGIKSDFHGIFSTHSDFRNLETRTNYKFPFESKCP